MPVTAMEGSISVSCFISEFSPPYSLPPLPDDALVLLLPFSTQCEIMFNKLTKTDFPREKRCF